MFVLVNVIVLQKDKVGIATSDRDGVRHLGFGGGRENEVVNIGREVILNALVFK